MTRAERIALEKLSAKSQAQTQEIAALRAALASARADYQELRRVTRLWQMGNRSGRRK